MKQFQVPQFITIEDRVVGPFTLKQFVYLGLGAVLIVLLRFVLALWLLIPSAVVIGSFAVSLAFLKLNDQPFPLVLKNAFLFFIRPRLYIWKQGVAKNKIPSASSQPEATVAVIPKISSSKLSDLAWSLDIKNQSRTEDDSQS